MLLELPTVDPVLQKTTVAPIGDAHTAGDAGVVNWSLCFISFLGLELNQAFGTWAIVVFLAPWFVIIIARPHQLSLAILRNWPLLMLPSFALLSVLWSREPAWSLRSALEYLATIVIGIAAANLVSRRTLLSALIAALTIVNTAGALYALHRSGLGLSGAGASPEGVAGLFGSKNQLAGAASVQVLLAVCYLLFDRGTIFRKGFFLAVVALGLLSFYLGRSGGAFVSMIAALSAMGLLRLFRTSRFLAVSLAVMVLLLGVAVISQVDIADLSATALSGLGKDKTLTGRTDLWKVAFAQIDEAPLTGVGFRAFWRPGNPTAEVLWAQFGIVGRVGFHFHDTYLQACVDLGLFGGLILLGTVVRALWSSVRRALNSAGPLEISVTSVLIFFVAWSLVEVEFIEPFLLSVVVLCLCASATPPTVSDSRS